jgi:hypothetical protein
MDSLMEYVGIPKDSNGFQYELLKTKNEELERRIEAERIYLKKEIERLTLALQESPDPVEFAQLQGKYEEIDNHNITLRAELEKAGQRYDNYMMQMQTLITQKSIKAPGTKKWWKFW